MAWSKMLWATDIADLNVYAKLKIKNHTDSDLNVYAKLKIKNH